MVRLSGLLYPSTEAEALTMLLLRHKTNSNTHTPTLTITPSAGEQHHSRARVAWPHLQIHHHPPVSNSSLLLTKSELCPTPVRHSGDTPPLRLPNSDVLQPALTSTSSSPPSLFIHYHLCWIGRMLSST
ncbi:hypothetical protein Tco_0009008 [Tanacetum coccineum]